VDPNFPVPAQAGGYGGQDQPLPGIELDHNTHPQFPADAQMPQEGMQGLETSTIDDNQP
jgi:hypothetical protein